MKFFEVSFRLPRWRARLEPRPDPPAGTGRRNAMDAQRWAVIESVYHAALGKEPGERSAYLAAACAEDPTLRIEVESLLGYADDAELSSPVEPSKMAELLDKIGEISPSEGPEPVRATEATTPPATIGRYRIL